MANYKYNNGMKNLKKVNKKCWVVLKAQTSEQKEMKNLCSCKNLPSGILLTEKAEAPDLEQFLYVLTAE